MHITHRIRKSHHFLSDFFMPKCSTELPETLPDAPQNTPRTSLGPPQTLPRHPQDRTTASKTSCCKDFYIFGVMLIGFLDFGADIGRMFE